MKMKVHFSKFSIARLDDTSVEVSATLAMFLSKFPQYTAVGWSLPWILQKIQIPTHQSPYPAFTFRYLPSTMSSYLLDLSHHHGVFCDEIDLPLFNGMIAHGFRTLGKSLAL